MDKSVPQRRKRRRRRRRRMEMWKSKGTEREA
jgi:hypothetical protein